MFIYESNIINTQNVYLLCGIPGSGKSTYCKKYYSGIPKVSRDEIRSQLGYTNSSDEKVVLSPEQEQQVTQQEYKQIQELLKNGSDVIIDDTNSNKRNRKYLISFLRKFNVKIIGINFNTPVEICVKRRKGQIPEEVMRKLADRFSPISSDEVDETRIANSITESYDFNKALMKFVDDIEFNKSQNTLDRSNKKAINKLYDFSECKYGDKLYYDETLGYNLINGEYIGFCIIETRQFDEDPRFVYKEDIGKYNWETAINKCKDIKNGYLPSDNELKIAYDNGLKKVLIKDVYYWTSSQYDSTYAVDFNTRDGGTFNDDKTDLDYVRPFIHILQSNSITETYDFNKALMQFDRDNIEFDKSSHHNKDINLSIKQLVIDNCNYLDKLWKSKITGKFKITDKSVNILNGYKHVGTCCANAEDSPNGYPIFSANTFIQKKGKIVEPNSYNTDLLSNTDGWFNTNVFTRNCPKEKTMMFGNTYKSEPYLCHYFRNLDPHMYIPSIEELQAAHEAGTLDHQSSYESSSSGEEQNQLKYIFDVRGGRGDGDCNDFKLMVIPFYKIEANDIEI